MSGQVRHGKGRIRVSGEMTIRSALELKQELFATLQRHRRSTQLDLSQVSEFDTAGLQLLLSAQRLAAEQGRALLVIEASSVVAEVLELCRLGAVLQSAAAQPA